MYFYLLYTGCVMQFMFVYVLFLYFSGRVFFYVAQYIVFGATQVEDLIC